MTAARSRIGASTLRSRALVAALALVALSSCQDLRLAASDLQIGPNPAVPGDAVEVSFLLLLVPAQRHTVIVLINDAEHLRLTSTEAPPVPYIIPLGDAADLIAEYGVGTHTVRIQVRAEDANETARTQSVPFELMAATP